MAKLNIIIGASVGYLMVDSWAFATALPVMSLNPPNHLLHQGSLDSISISFGVSGVSSGDMSGISSSVSAACSDSI